MTLFLYRKPLDNQSVTDDNGIIRHKEWNRMIDTVLGKMINYLGSDAKRIHHAMKVYSFSIALWEEEARERGLDILDERRETLLLAAILHDIGIHEAERKYNSSEGKYQEKEGPSIAGEILEECGVEDKISARVCYLVGHHHTYHLIDDLDFQILVEADLFVNLEEEHMASAAILSVRDKYMKTAGSKRLLDSYLL